MENPKIVFMGTPEFAVPSLAKIHDKYGVTTVVTVPDKPRGRGQKLIPSAIKKAAIEMNIPVLQPEKMKDETFASQIAEISPDIICVIAFKILPPQIYEKANLGSFNIHGSLLPKYRGAAPINWAIINGEKITGVTSFLLKKKVDTGDILIKRELAIPDGSTAGDLHDLMMPLAADAALETIDLIVEGKAKPINQDDTEATPAPKLFRDDCKIDWTEPSEKIRNFIHGTSPVPGSWTEFNGKRMKLVRCDMHNNIDRKPGEFECSDDSIIVQCGEGAIVITELQMQGKKMMRACDFLCGWRGQAAGRFE